MGFCILIMSAPKEINRLDPEVLIPKIKNFKQKLTDFISRKKKLTIGIIFLVLLLSFVGYRRYMRVTNNPVAKSIKVEVSRSFDFAALNNLGKPSGAKIKFKIVDAEKTDTVLVKDQTYTAKNNKTFLIFNLDLRNDETTLQNIIPGDLVRLAIAGNDDTRFAPDLHNSLVGVAAISTKSDRVGFVIPMEAKNFKLYVGELEGKKEEVKVDFPS